MPLYETSHPLVQHKMTLLRNKLTGPNDFRTLLKEIAFYLGYEATRCLTNTSIPIVTPMNVNFDGKKIAEKIAIIPILRAGLGMSDALLELLPRAVVHHIGMFRVKDSLMPVQYYNRLPRNNVADVAYICDPCIATSNTVSAVVSIVKKWGAKKIVVIATIGAREGIDKLMKSHPDIDIYIGAIDEILSVDGMIIPGVGDAGDRQFGTPCDDVPGENPDTKRLRTDNNISSST